MWRAVALLAAVGALLLTTQGQAEALKKRKLTDPAPQPAGHVWVENWDAPGDAWRVDAASSCRETRRGKLVVTCPHGGSLLSNRAWSGNRPISVETRISGAPCCHSTTTDYFASVTLLKPTSTGDQFASLATASGVPPCEFKGWGANVCSLNPFGWPYAHATPGQFYDLRVQFDGTRWTDYFVDGVYVDRREMPHLAQSTLHVFLICGTTGEFEMDNGSMAECQFGPVTVWWD